MVTMGGLTTSATTNITYDPYGPTAISTDWTRDRLWWSFESRPAIDFDEELARFKSEAKAAYRARRESESSRAMHFERARAPAVHAKPARDPLRHQRSRGFRLCSRRDQSELRAETRRKGR
jgi:hypothetical protein